MPGMRRAGWRRVHFRDKAKKRKCFSFHGFLARLDRHWRLLESMGEL